MPQSFPLTNFRHSFLSYTTYGYTYGVRERERERERWGERRKKREREFQSWKIPEEIN